MNVQLTPELARFIDEQVKTGRFDSAQEAVNAAVAQLQTDQELAEELSPEELAELRAEIEIGIQQADRGEVMEWNPDEILAEVERRHQSELREKGT